MAPEPWLERLDLPRPTFEPAHYGPEEERFYGEVIDIFTAGDVPFLLAGAFALNAHTGIWRSTKDLDFFLRPGDLPLAFRALARAGYEPEVVDDVWLSKATRGEVFVDIIHANANGMFPVDDTWFEHALDHEIFGRKVKVAPAEEVILSKIFVASRERYDGMDVLHFIFAREGRLDWARLVRKIGEHAGLLLSYLHLFQYAYPRHAHFVPRAVIDELDKRAKVANARAPGFRGVLLDPLQGAVDVEVFGLPDERARVRDGAVRGPEPGQAEAA